MVRVHFQGWRQNAQAREPLQSLQKINVDLLPNTWIFFFLEYFLSQLLQFLNQLPDLYELSLAIYLHLLFLKMCTDENQLFR